MNAADVIGAEIIEFVEKPAAPAEEFEADQAGDCDIGGDVVDVHFYTLVTTMGRMDVTMHVEHNGYYGGWLNGPTVVDKLPEGAKDQTDERQQD